MLQDLDAERAFNFIDSILIDDLIYVSRDEEAILKLRAEWNKIYDREPIRLRESPESANSWKGYDDDEEKPEGYIPGNYFIPDDDGVLPGFTPPKMRPR